MSIIHDRVARRMFAGKAGDHSSDFLANCPRPDRGYVVKVIRSALSIPLAILAGVAGVVAAFSIFLAFAIYGVANQLYGGHLVHDVASWHLSRGDKRDALPTD
jgi:hypothetical protein